MTKPNKPTAIHTLKSLPSGETSSMNLLMNCILELSDQVQELQLQQAANKVRSFADIDPPRPMSMEEYLFGKEKVPGFGDELHDPTLQPAMTVNGLPLYEDRNRTDDFKPFEQDGKLWCSSKTYRELLKRQRKSAVPGFSLDELQQEKIEQANQVVRDFKRAGLVEKTFCGLKPGQTYNGPDGNKWTFTQEGNPTASPEEKVLELCGNQPEGVVFISFRLFSELMKSVGPNVKIASVGPNVEIANDQSITVLTSQGERKVRPSKDVGYEIKTPAATIPSAPPADVSDFIERLKHAIRNADDNEDGDTVAVFDGVYEVTELQAVLAILQRNNK